jgi:succinate dehydrogenase/fumarate reductase flavoprotein subunit
MASFDDDVVIIGSGFGGNVAALRAAEKGDFGVFGKHNPTFVAALSAKVG